MSFTEIIYLQLILIGFYLVLSHAFSVEFTTLIAWQNPIGVLKSYAVNYILNTRAKFMAAQKF